MWILVQVIKGNKYFEAESRVENHVLISDTSEMVIAGRALGTDGYRFEARKGNESFVVSEFPAREGTGPLIEQFKALAQRMGAIVTAQPG
jgi:hypothetical protein